MNKLAIVSVALAFGIIILALLSKYSISVDAVPSLSEFINQTLDVSTSTADGRITNDMGEVKQTGSGTKNSFSQTLNLPTKDIRIGKNKISAYIADTTELLQRGLGGYQSLSPDQGMFFVFDSTSSRGFWMKDMLFPLDIVWIDSEKNIVGIDADISPQTYPNVFNSPVPIRYVLELNAGQTKEFGLKIGQVVSF